MAKDIVKHQFRPINANIILERVKICKQSIDDRN